MSKTVSVFVADLFAERPGQGARVGVVFDGQELTDAQLMGITLTLRHQMVFMVPPEGEGTVRFRFFSPGKELPLSGTGALGAAWLLAAGPQGPREGAVLLPVETGVGEVRCLAKLEKGNPLEVTIELPIELGPEVEADEAAQALGLHPLSVRVTGLPVRQVTAGLPKLLVPTVNAAALAGLEPDPDQVRALCERLGVSGVVAFAHEGLEAGLQAQLRHFAPLFPFEDPVNAEGAAAVAAYLYAEQVVTDGPVLVGQGRALPAKVDLAYQGSQPSWAALRAKALIIGRADLSQKPPEVAEPGGAEG